MKETGNGRVGIPKSHNGAAATSGREVRVAISTEADLITARQEGRALAAELRFAPADLVLIATAISELAKNVLSYAEQGDITLRMVQDDGRDGITIVAHDRGPGMADPGRAVQDGFSTSGGLGLGLPGVRRLMDEFSLCSRPGETTVTVTKWNR